jgi:mRNA interferase MazF
MYQARQGDIILVDFNPQKGFGQRGLRPAIVVSNNFFNKLSSLVLVCPITNTSTEYPLNVPLNEKTKTTGSILCQHIRSMDYRGRNASYIETLPADILQEVLNIIHSEF